MYICIYIYIYIYNFTLNCDFFCSFVIYFSLLLSPEMKRLVCLLPVGENTIRNFVSFCITE